MPLFVARSTTSRPDLPSRANPITTSRKTAAHRGKPQLAASPCEDTFSNGPTPRHRTWRLGARPPRSHSQIHFTLQSTPAPAPAPPADTRPPGRPAPGNDALSSPNAGPGITSPGSEHQDRGGRLISVVGRLTRWR